MSIVIFFQVLVQSMRSLRFLIAMRTTLLAPSPVTPLTKTYKPSMLVEKANQCTPLGHLETGGGSLSIMPYVQFTYLQLEADLIFFLDSLNA